MHCSLCGVSSNSGSHEERQKKKQKKRKTKKKKLQTNPVYNKLSLTELQFGICRVFVEERINFVVQKAHTILLVNKKKEGRGREKIARTPS